MSCREPTGFLDLASGSAEYLVRDTVSYPVVLAVLAFMMGLGKGGVPGSSTSSVALNSLLAPPFEGCLDASVAMGVPLTFLADCAVVASYARLARWDVITRLLPATGVGVALGTQLMGRLSDSGARLLIGCILLGILMTGLLQPAPATTAASPALGGAAVAGAAAAAAGAAAVAATAGSAAATGAAPDAKPDVVASGKGRSASQLKPAAAPCQEEVCGDASELPAYATSIWFASLVGVVGGFATILTNSMGPILNVYLLTLRLEPAAFVGTRATFFTVVNTLKLVQRLYAGSLSPALALLGSGYGLFAVLGVLVSKQVVRHMSKRLFMRLEYALMTFASLKLIDAGLQLGLLP